MNLQRYTHTCLDHPSPPCGHPSIHPHVLLSTQTHGRHLVGGRAPLAKDEVLYRVEFPEKPGALRKFLYSLSSKRNISLFHYRSHTQPTQREGDEMPGGSAVWVAVNEYGCDVM